MSTSAHGRRLSSEEYMARVELPLTSTTIDVVAPDSLLRWLSERPAARRLLLGHNLHSVYLCEAGQDFRAIYRNADVVVPDGFPVWFAARRTAKRSGGSLPRGACRIGSTDWIARLHEIAHPMHVAVVGADTSSNDEAVRRLTQRFPMHTFRGWDGYDGQRELVRDRFSELFAFRPDIVLVGMGMPFQEEWLARHWSQLPRATYAAVGGAIDQVAGSQSLAPRKLGAFGLEWLWRLASDPRRLAGRYLIEPFKLVFLLLRNRIADRRARSTR